MLVLSTLRPVNAAAALATRQRQQKGENAFVVASRIVSFLKLSGSTFLRDT